MNDIAFGTVAVAGVATLDRPLAFRWIPQRTTEPLRRLARSGKAGHGETRFDRPILTVHGRRCDHDALRDGGRHGDHRELKEAGLEHGAVGLRLRYRQSGKRFTEMTKAFDVFGLNDGAGGKQVAQRIPLAAGLV